ncbi:1-aminocyclopropane-1-carboxylate deaminase/D-cysteine desulfhydrase [Butyrivibrio sp. AE2015]|uniref:1-aminocyclopropane-1-carboxylate deaminase/D-cysteine desulfhydrase n=1 Tax=Butyrivibrio sp. AE2015 TaxID=1280663 RepID=UPI0003B4ACBB|nr:pyridoxal-phosphate dependent enzyme [Butyrivibrio sp. AE2015]
MDMTPTYKLNSAEFPSLYVKREDMIPYSFGGNKARKAIDFFQDIDKGDYDYVVTYGSSHSNHCRVVANMAAERGKKCVIIGPSEVSDVTYNSRMMELFGAEIITVPVDKVSGTIDDKLDELKAAGHKPYFIMGGGHGNIGTYAYVKCYQEIKEFERANGISFDYIFFASGTGTTHAGLVCGQLKNEDDKKIIGISIARKNPRGRDVVIDSIREFLKEEPGTYLGKEITEQDIQDKTIFLDDYTGDGYGEGNAEIQNVIQKSLVMYGMPLDSTYTGKAFLGMEKYIRHYDIADKNILFIHTGGTPLFFDDLDKIRR